ncbi:MAG: alkaline shock response membrane anchor protein AmaP [Mycobacterium sp.]
MTRLAVAFDRLAALIFGAAIAGMGGFLVWTRVRSDAVGHLPLQWLADAVDRSWWSWATAVGGVLLILLGLRWLAAHHRASKAGRLGLGDTVDGGVLTADPGAVADAAAVALRSHSSVLKASGRATVERGVPTITLTATTSARNGLAAVAAAADGVALTVASMTGDTIAVRTRIHVDAKRRRNVD